MDKETIQQIATEVVHRLPYGDHPWLFLLVTVVVMALVGAVAALATSYFRTRGQNLATKHDFDELRKQLKVNTELVETIKSEVSQRDWARREWTNLRRTKLEALLEKMHECELYLDRQRDRAFDGKPATPERDCISEADALAALYFPELESEANQFVLSCRKQQVLISQLLAAVIMSRDDPAARQAAYQNFQSQFEYGEFRTTQTALTAAARTLLKRIMNVDEGA